jgi:hypothetical protein
MAVAKSFFTPKVELGGILKAPKVGGNRPHTHSLTHFILTIHSTHPYSFSLSLSFSPENEFENQYSDACNYDRIHFWDQRYLDDMVSSV